MTVHQLLKIAHRLETDVLADAVEQLYTLLDRGQVDAESVTAAENLLAQRFSTFVCPECGLTVSGELLTSAGRCIDCAAQRRAA